MILDVLRQIKKQEIEKDIELFGRIEELTRQIEKLSQKSNLPAKRYSFWERYFTKRREYKTAMDGARIEAKQREEEIAKAQAELEKLKTKARSIRFKYGSLEEGTERYFLERKKDEVDRAKSPKDLGYYDEEDISNVLDRFTTQKDWMIETIKKDSSMVFYDKTDAPEVYLAYLRKKIEELQLQDQKAHSNSNAYKIEEMSRYILEIEQPSKVAEGMYKVPHKFIFEEIRNYEAPKRENSGDSNGRNSFNYFNVDGKLPKAFGEEMEGIYSRPDIIVGIHGTRQAETNIFTNGIRESVSYSRERMANNTILYGTYLNFTTLLDYGRILSYDKTFLVGLPKNAFSQRNPAYIWGENEKDGKLYLNPDYVLGYYNIGEQSQRKFIKNTQNNKTTYRYWYQDATVDPKKEHKLDAQDAEREA